MEVPALGSPRDKVFREYLTYESRVEAKKQQLMLLLIMGSPVFHNASDRRNWNEQSKKIYSQYVNMLMGNEISEEDLQEEEMLSFYENVVKATKPIMSKNSEGKLSVTGVDGIFGK